MKKRFIPLLSLCCLTLIAGCNNEPTSLSSVFSFEESSEGQESHPSRIDAQKLVSDRALVKWEGRYEYKLGDLNTPTMVYLYHTATGFSIDFYGTSLTVGFYHYLNEKETTDIYYDFALDEETLPNPVEGRRFSLSKDKMGEEITLINGLKEGHHHLKCLKMNEAIDAYTGITSFQTDGYFYYRDEIEDTSRLKFLAVCASGGSGFGSLGYSTVSKTAITKTRANSSSLHAFNYLTARRFAADIHFVATSGWGVHYPENHAIPEILDYCGNTPKNSVSAAKKTGKWDPKNYIPDVILFNIGGNDTGNASFDVNIYKESVVQMVNKLRGYYPKAKMLWTHTGSKAGGYAINALTQSQAISDGYVTEVVIPNVGEGETGEGTYGASNHASLKTHLDIEHILVDTLQTKFHYQPTVDDISFEQFESFLDQ